ncbi:hypothetical protein B0T17DRAFT_616912 [Bombardia bombarda]|uniref:Uncharacterized protein n=1 Tax=Bombardia bombarda TaxID=252184 RepID=A0AA40C4F8_9PEZI|nr:hypothetical protein B0T17DRAFT_616912 [Bombardia bombarda]
MGLLDDLSSDRSRSKSRSHSRSRHGAAHSSHSHSHSHSHAGGGGLGGLAASIFGGGADDDSDLDYKRTKSHHHHRSSSSHHKDKEKDRSFFNLGNASRSSFFSGFGGNRSPSYYKRSPRPNFVSRVLRRLKRLLRDLVYYAKRHPLKVFMLVIMPLITGGALTALLARFGLRLPRVVERMLGMAAKAGSGDSIGLVGEAVRMASGGLGGGVSKSGFNHSHASIERGRDGGIQWERRSVEKDNFGGGGGGMWGDGLKGIYKMFS